MDMVRKSFGKRPLKNLTMERKRVEEFEKSLMWRLWMNQSCFTLGFLSQNSLWKLSFFCGYKGYLYWGEIERWRVRFFQNRGGSRLDWVARSNCEITERPVVLFLSCSAPASMTLQLLACLARVLLLAAWSRKSPARSSRESLFSCTLLSISTLYLTYYPYNNPT